MLIETMYNKLAINTGFPLYIDETSTPESTQFLLEMLNQALLNTIDNIYISNNVLERTDRIVTTPGKDHYAIEGMVKNIQYSRDASSQLRGVRIPFLYNVDVTNQIPRMDTKGYPKGYCIDKGDIRLFPIPDKVYPIEVTVSTTDLVWANDDSSRNSIEDIKDSLMASKDFCELVVLRACAFTMARCQNPLSEFYNNLYEQRRKMFIERDSRSFEKPHLYNPIKGHYNPRKGLID
ncbi:MAG: hypothetical protein II393_02295 [Cytophagales bacterium]|nr:hypothetical protein [Cytophagales bacterium]